MTGNRRQTRNDSAGESGTCRSVRALLEIAFDKPYDACVSAILLPDTTRADSDASEV